MAGGNPFMPPGVLGSGGVPASESPTPSGRPQPEGASIGAPTPQPAGPPSGNAMVPPSRQGQPFADVHQNLKYVKNQYDTNMKAQKVLDHLRVELDQLMDMGDMVRPEHVIEAAGRLVGHGIGATQLAQIMSDMPSQGGEGLASWIRMHDISVTGAEQHLAQNTAVLQHRMGVAGIKSLAALHLEQEATQGPKPPISIDMRGPPQGMPSEAASGGGNALMGPQGGSSDGGEGG